MANLDPSTVVMLMNVTIYFFVFLFGITIGSFLNVCIYRLPKGESLITNNSHCMTCGTQIKRYDLIPVFSWLILRGKCRACGAKITPRYMIIELLTGLVFLAVFLRYDFFNYGLYPVMLSLFLAGEIVLCFQDIDNREMCVSVLIYTAVIAAATQLMRVFMGDAIFLPETNLKDGIIGMFSVSLVLLIIGFVITPLFYKAFVSEEHSELKLVKRQLKAVKEGSGEYKKLCDKKQSLEKKISEIGPVYGFGMGDVILMAAGGLMLGVKATVTAAIVAVFIGGIYGIVKKITTDSEDNAFAFGPFLIIGLAVGAFTNGSLIDFYINTFIKM